MYAWSFQASSSISYTSSRSKQYHFVGVLLTLSLPAACSWTNA